MKISDYIIDAGEKPNMLYFQYKKNNQITQYCGLDILIKNEKVCILLTSPGSSNCSVMNNLELIITDVYVLLKLDNFASSAEQLEVYFIHLRDHLSFAQQIPKVTAISLEYNQMSITNIKSFRDVDHSKVPFDLSYFIVTGKNNDQYKSYEELVP